MSWYLKIEGTGGGTSGSGIANIEVYDQKGELVKLTKNDVIETNATTRNAEDNYIQMFQTRGGLTPYNGIASGIYYTIKLPNYVDGFAKIFLKNWGNSSYNVSNIKVNVSKDNSDYQEIYSENYIVNEEKTVLQGYSLQKRRFLLQSENKTYSLEHINLVHETKMTSNTAPTPRVASASSVYTTTYSAWKAFNGTVTDANDAWVTPTGVITGWIQIDYGESFQKNVNILTLTSRNSTIVEANPKDFDILGSNDGITFDTLAKFRNQTNWAQVETRTFKFRNDNSYRYYRIQILNNNGHSFISIGDILFSYNVNYLIELPSPSKDNLINYGNPKMDKLDEAIDHNNYIIQSANERGLYTVKTSRKPKGIKIK